MSGFMGVGLIVLCVYAILGYKRPLVALATVPVAAFMIGYTGLSIVDRGLMGLAAALLVVALVAVSLSGLRAETRQWFHWCAWWLLIVVVSLLVLGPIVAGFYRGVSYRDANWLTWSLATSPSLKGHGNGFILPLLFVPAVIAILALLINHGVAARRTTNMHVFSTLGASIRQNLPLPMALNCAAAGFECGTASVLRGIKTWLVQGYSLTEAVQRGYPQCPSRALALLSIGERIDQLPAALTAIETDIRSQLAERRKLRPVHPIYPIIVLSIAFVIAVGLMARVIPMTREIIGTEEGVTMPVSTLVLTRMLQAMLYPGPRLCLGLLVLVIVIYLLYRASCGRRPRRWDRLLRLGDSLQWHLPLVHWFEKTRALVQTTDLLRISLSAGCPVNEAIRSTLDLDVNLCFRERLARWLQRVERGERIDEAARRCGLGTALAWAFDNAVHTTDTPVVLEMLEAHYRALYYYYRNLARYILWPLGIVLLGAIVGFIIYAAFSPSVVVLRHLAFTVYP